MDFSVETSDWSILYPTIRPAKTAPVAADKDDLPAETPTFKDFLKEDFSAPVAVVRKAEESLPETNSVPQTTAKFVVSGPVVLPTSEDFRPQPPTNILPETAKTGTQTKQNDDLTPIVASATALPGDRLNTEMNRTRFYTDKSLYRTDALKQSKQTSPYNMNEKTRENRTRPLQGVEGLTAHPIGLVRRYNQSSKPAFNTAAPANNSIAEARDAVKKQTARAESRRNEEIRRDSVREKQIGSGELVSMMRDDKIGYDRGMTPSMTNGKNSAAAAWIPEATTRALDGYEAARKLAK